MSRLKNKQNNSVIEGGKSEDHKSNQEERTPPLPTPDSPKWGGSTLGMTDSPLQEVPGWGTRDDHSSWGVSSRWFSLPLSLPYPSFGPHLGGKDFHDKGRKKGSRCQKVCSAQQSLFLTSCIFLSMLKCLPLLKWLQSGHIRMGKSKISHTTPPVGWLPYNPPPSKMLTGHSLLA